MPASMDSPSPKRLPFESEDESAEKDRISYLPHDVIGFILSLLRSKEAQATCLLSRRWRHLSTYQILKLQSFDSPKENLLIHQLPKLTSVKLLELKFDGARGASLLPLTLVIEACPCLQSFVFEMTYPWEMLCTQRELERVVGSPHWYLKEVEFNNYHGQLCDLELVYYLVENAPALEKLVVNPCVEQYLKDVIKSALQQLKGKLPPRIELVIN
ncbi:uncharacterized protein LOC115662048 [Syzygium oleosum]|uniref:uncharacterized protein LOC115662048 n=1 Tax=Syzygium oleosum TaxID=219896 RepID=UPI0024B89549|nr:uncharacterized protein LOC115662048 [Syzygium oleosum]